jgi:hypothetical protein
VIQWIGLVQADGKDDLIFNMYSKILKKFKPDLKMGRGKWGCLRRGKYKANRLILGGERG